MGKKGNWFSAIKNFFTHDAKDKVIVSEKKSTKDKKKGFGRRNSFIPLFREPSSIEKILGDAEREHNIIFRPPTTLDEPVQPTVVTPRVASFSIVPQHENEITYAHEREPSSLTPNAAATKIQSAYRGYMARRSFRALRGLVRLQSVIRGQSVIRQTKNAMKHMQLLVRVQSQIQTRRIHMIDNQALYKTNNEADLDNQEEWDDSLLTKEQIEEQIQRKMEATIKRERALSYAYSHQGKNTSKGVQTTLAGIPMGGIPRWWNWLEHESPQANIVTPERQSIKLKASPKPQTSNYKPYPSEIDSFDANTPNSTKSLFTPKWNQTQNPKGQQSTPQIPRLTKDQKPRPSVTQSMTYDNTSLKDDASLTSCPPFSVPNYMTPTVAAKGKLRFNNNTTPVSTPTKNESKRRFSLPSTQGGFSSFKWNKGSLFSSKDSKSSKKVNKDNYAESMDNRSVDSTVSLPAGVGRKPFNRFV